MSVYEYKGKRYPEYLKGHNAVKFIQPVASHFCSGNGVDLGCGRNPLPGALGKDAIYGDDLMDFPEMNLDYVFSSHCLEHLEYPVEALTYWISKLRKGGCLFLYLPHPDMEYWRPENCKKHLHSFNPAYVGDLFVTLNLRKVITSERDMAWSFSTVGFK